MPDTTLSGISRAASDSDLLDRLISAAAADGVDNAEAWARMNARQLSACPITPEGDTIASVYAYAVARYSPPPPPGAGPLGSWSPAAKRLSASSGPGRSAA